MYACGLNKVAAIFHRCSAVNVDIHVTAYMLCPFCDFIFKLTSNAYINATVFSLYFI